MSNLLLMHRLFRRLQQKNRFIGRGAKSGLTTAETHFILELQADLNRTIMDLAELLGFNQSSCSRITQSLVRRGLIKSSVSPVDSRRKVLSLTARGISTVQAIDQGAEQIIAGYASRISSSEMALLVRLFRAIADGYEHAAGVQRKGESAYRVEQRRLTRCFGMLGDQVFGSSLNSSQWQALSEIVLCPVAPQATELSVVLGLAQNSLSSVLDGLSKEGLIDRRAHAEDKRITVLVPRAAGQKLCQQIETRAVADLHKSLKDFSATEMERGADILRRFVGEVDPLLPPLLPGYSLRSMQSAAERRQARGFAARMLVSAGMEDSIPETFLPQSSALYMVSSEQGDEAVLECVSNRSGVEIRSAAWSATVSPFVLLGALHQTVFTAQTRDKISGRVDLTFEPLKEFLGIKSLTL